MQIWHNREGGIENQVMADFNFIGVMGAISTSAQIKDGTAVFGLTMRTATTNIEYKVFTMIGYLIEKSITPYIIEENIGKRIFVQGSILEQNVIKMDRIYFVDALTSINQIKRLKEQEIDFSED